MDHARKILVDLTNATSRAKDALVVADLDSIHGGIDAAKTAAIIAVLSDAQKAAAASSSGSRPKTRPR
jgi:hypothetical protein